ncbi:sulfatase-like hydrolase/transferase [Amycolatopsis sp. NPDC047767]|uniref:sulfatase n=1 Tax=Amycolatopsis sp. NPDC047767 TaxID=3156765 RepID=UPI003455E80E
MRAIVVLFDTLNRRYLPPYGATGVHAPQFERLAEAAVTFDNCYAGSMPCMPARRELHTGRYNFLHRSWGPLEPFDDSVPELLSRHGVHTHLVTDHRHYWEDGGATYHNRFDTYEFFRGQEGDRWKGQVADPDIPEPAVGARRASAMIRQHWVNRQHFLKPGQHPQTLTVDAGLEFLGTNAGEQDWFLQIECFDPHEPFVATEDHRARYSLQHEGPKYDWPGYRRVTEQPGDTVRVRDEYRALLSMCDSSLGRVLDAMDTHGLWDDTLLIVCTDHGLLLGEHGWWGKNVQPWYDENIHTPLFVWDPRTGARGERRAELVQTVDFGPTLLDFFGVPRPPDMQGLPMTGATTREACLFGSFGAHVNVTDGRYVYLRASATPANEPLFEHTLMPTHMNTRFSPAELRDAELIPPLPFTKGAGAAPARLRLGRPARVRHPAVRPRNRPRPAQPLGRRRPRADHGHPAGRPDAGRRRARVPVRTPRPARRRTGDPGAPPGPRPARQRPRRAGGAPAGVRVRLRRPDPDRRTGPGRP